MALAGLKETVVEDNTLPVGSMSVDVLLGRRHVNTTLDQDIISDSNVNC